MLFIYDKVLEAKEKLSYEMQGIIETRDLGKNLVNSFTEKHYEHVMMDSHEEENKFSWGKNMLIKDSKLSLQNIFLEIFKKQEIKDEGQNLKLENFSEIDVDDSNLISFLSSINFYDNLCNICEIMRVAPIESQLKLLHSELCKINMLLPSNIYIPFLSDTIRNYVIVHIPVSETRIFRTKNRAPYMITIELIRIDELI